MKKVYLVSTGSYSDYQIERVFSSKELAEQYVEAQGLYEDYNDIEEFDLDSPIPKKKDLYAFRVDVLKSGDIYQAWADASYESRINEQPRYIENYSGGDPKLMFIVMARDKEHAVKIAHDKAMEIKATVGWGKLIE